MGQSGYGYDSGAGAGLGTDPGPVGHRQLSEAAEAQAWSKVPEVTVLFWTTKILTTGMGETTSDFLSKSPAVGGALGLIGFTGFLWLQFRAPRYSPWIYWGAIVMVSIFGTMAADIVHVVGIPYAVSTVVFVLALAGILTAWYRSEGTLSIHSIHTPRRERFYWATVLATFALGTAAGDLTATSFRLGYFSSGVLFAALIAVPALARLAGLNAVAAFWWAYVLTRPLGASFADWMGVSKDRGGLGWGTGPVSLVLAVLIAALVACLAAQHRRHRRPAVAAD
ncbi:COG4705 family protein [Streptomyces sp. NBC_01198]|uniref:COG4705 family protein n=1 Tax=Streptomyces sp. NBC_01198 TaxID=2903769 RepID=UPI003FA3C72E